MGRWQVVVGNIGTVYDGDDVGEADLTFRGYVKASASGLGRGAHEGVTIFQDGEPAKEHNPPIIENKCGCNGKWDDSRIVYDCHGIYLTRVCEQCKTKKLSKYRPEVFTGYIQEDIDEPIEEAD